MAKLVCCEVLAHNLRTLCTDDALRIHMGDAARSWVCKYFNLSVQTGRLESLYMQVLERRATPVPTDSREEGRREEDAALDS